MKNLNEQIAFFATQYCSCCDFNHAIKKSIQELILGDELGKLDTAYLISAFNDYLTEEDKVDDWLYDNDDIFFDFFFDTPIEAVRASMYGDYRYADDYVKFNGYGNLDSFQEYEVRRLIREDSEFLDYIYEYCFDPSDYDINLDEIKESLERLLSVGF